MLSGRIVRCKLGSVLSGSFVSFQVFSILSGIVCLQLVLCVVRWSVC